MASQQPEVTLVAEGDHPLSPSTAEDVPDDSAQPRSEEASDMPQTVENGESIYRSTTRKRLETLHQAPLTFFTCL